MGIEHFPPDVFFVLRVTQMLRGLAAGMKARVCVCIPSAHARMRACVRM